MVRLLSEKMKKRVAPVTVAAEGCGGQPEHRFGDKVDITKFPAPKMWPLDGGK